MKPTTAFPLSLALGCALAGCMPEDERESEVRAHLLSLIHI